MNTHNSRQIGGKRTAWFALAKVKRLTALALLALLSACSSKVTVVSNIPTPLVQKVPLNVHLSYTEEFRNHVYIENEKKRALTSLNFADAQIEMFDTIFGGMTNLVSVEDASRDLTVEPEVLEFQYTAPSETKLKQYEVWIKYRLKLFDSDDAKVADWAIKGYGKTPTALLTSATKAFNSAANVALRDVGAQLATQFAGQRKIKAMIDSKATSEQEAAVAKLAEAATAEASDVIKVEKANTDTDEARP